MSNKSNSKNQETSIDDIINEIKQKSKDGNYIYRGENNKEYCKISSTLYREYFNDEDPNIDFKGFDLRIAQREILNVAKKHLGEPPRDLFEDFTERSPRRSIRLTKRPIIDSEELEILTELQHYGGKTNLIDFTTDYLIAIFFACDGCPTKDGRIILLQRTESLEKTMIVRPLNPQRRVIAQKSVFLYPPEGVIDEFNAKIVYIPAHLKKKLLEFLRKYHNISAETIYNDIHGFIINQKIHHTTNKEFYIGVTFQRKADDAKTDSEKQDAYKQAITHYSRSIELNSEYASVYYNRGQCRLHLEEWEKAGKDLTIAQDMGIDIAAAFHRDYKRGPEEFQEKTGIQMPKPITVLLGH